MLSFIVVASWSAWRRVRPKIRFFSEAHLGRRSPSPATVRGANIPELPEHREVAVQAMRILAIVLIVVGLLGLAYEGITYTKREKVLEVGPITATKETKKTIPLPPVLGGAALVCGVVLLIASARP